MKNYASNHFSKLSMLAIIPLALSHGSKYAVWVIVGIKRTFNYMFRSRLFQFYINKLKFIITAEKSSS